MKKSLNVSFQAAGAAAAGFIIAACIVQPAPQGPMAQPPTAGPTEGPSDGVAASPESPNRPRGMHRFAGFGGAAKGGVAPTAPPATGIQPGDYACAIQNGDYEYPPFRCVISNGADGHVLLIEKVGGSQRFRGTLAATQGGYNFEGTFFCPWGSCDEEVSGLFAPSEYGTYQAQFKGANGGVASIVTMLHMPGGFTYGGSTYGGASYGGASYGGATYGGATYGGATYAQPPAKK